MQIKVISPEELELKEKDIQRALESDLSRLEEGLEYIDTEVNIGTGRIDTLAFDTNSGCPVFIEYKRQGEFGKEALIQLMDYLSWFARDENRMAILEKIIRERKTNIEDFEPSIRLVCVVSNIDERIRNALYAITNHVKVFSYMLARDTGNNIILVPKLEVDNSEIETRIRDVSSGEDLLKKNSHLSDIFNDLRKIIEKDDVVSYTTANSFRFKKDRVFAVARFRKKYIQLELRAGKGKILDSDFKYWRQGDSTWGYTYIYPSKKIPEKVVEWIENARNNNESEQTDDILQE